MRRTNTDTADRLRNTDQVLIGGKYALILGIRNAPTASRPARLALSVCDPHGSLADLDAAHTEYVDAGEVVTFVPGSTHLADAAGRRPGGADQQFAANAA